MILHGSQKSRFLSRTSRLTLPAIALVLAVLACAQLPPASTITPGSGIVMTLVASKQSQPALTTASPGSSCAFDFFPTDENTTWEFNGSNPFQGSYKRKDVITDSNEDGYTVTSELPGKTLTLEYGCTPAGIVLLDPTKMFPIATGSGASGTATMKTLGHSGISLPVKLKPGLNWQQTVDWQMSGSGSSIHGMFTMNYNAMSIDSVTVPFGTFDAVRVDTQIQIQMDGKDAGTCDVSTWFAKGIGIIKQDYTCPNLDAALRNHIELTNFVPGTP